MPEDLAPFLGTNVFPEGNYFDLCDPGPFPEAEYGFAFAGSFVSGSAAADPKREEKMAPMNNNARRFYLVGRPGRPGSKGSTITCSSIVITGTAPRSTTTGP